MQTNDDDGMEYDTLCEEWRNVDEMGAKKDGGAAAGGLALHDAGNVRRRLGSGGCGRYGGHSGRARYGRFSECSGYGRNSVIHGHKR
jgi:hypothetical protein